MPSPSRAPNATTSRTGAMLDRLVSFGTTDPIGTKASLHAIGGPPGAQLDPCDALIRRLAVRLTA